MRSLRFSVLFLVLSLLVSACGSKKAPGSSKAPEIGYQRTSEGWSVWVKFSEDMVDPNKVNETASTETIFNVTPAVPGKIKWTATNQLQFTPDDNTPPAKVTVFELVQVEGKKGARRSPKPGAWKITVNPSRLALGGAEIATNFAAGEATIRLGFNLAPDFEALKKAVSVKVAGAATEVELTKVSDFSVAAKFKVPPVERPMSVQLAIAAGVKPADGKLEAMDATSRTFDLLPPDLVIDSIEYQTGANGYYLSIRCTDRAMSESESYLCEIPDEELAKVKLSPSDSNRPPTLVQDQSGFRILGDFHRGEYKVTLPTGFRTRAGGILKEARTLSVSVPARAPRVRFSSRGRYLPRKRLGSIPVQYLNVKEFTVTVREVPEQNLVFWFSGRNEDADDRTSDQLTTKKILVKSEEDRESLVWLNLKGMVPETGRGLYEIGLSADEIESDYSRLILTDLALVAKRTGKDGQDLMVWVLNAGSLAPAAAAKVEVRTKSNVLISSATADENGLARLTGIAAKDAPAPYAVLARTDADFTGLKFSDLELQLAEFSVTGDPFQTAAAYRTAIWTDRGAYRPGDEAHLATALWEDAGRAPAQPVPVVAKLLDPRGNESARFTGKTNPAGLAVFDHRFPDFAITGKYQLVLEAGGAEIGREEFWVEEFMPERVKVKVGPKSAQLQPGAPAAFDLAASYLFGAVARGEPFEAECSLESAEFKPKKLADYYFGVYRTDELKPIPLGKVTGSLNDEGKAEFICPPMVNYLEMMGPARVRARVAVMEAGSGRTSTSDGTLAVHPDERYVGLKSSTREAGPNQKVTVSGVVVGLDGEPANGTFAVALESSLVEVEESWRFNPASGHSEWQNYPRRLRSSTQEVSAVNGRFTFSFDTGDGGEGYLVSAKLGKNALTELYIPMSGSNYYWCDECDSSSTPKPSTPEALAITAPAAVQTGEQAEATIDAPFVGRLLFSVETDEVLTHRWVDVLQPGPVKLDFSVPKFTPNVYLSALMIKNPTAESKEAFIPARAFGVVSVKVKPVDDELIVTLTVPPEMRPNHELTVDVQAAAAADGSPLFATVAAVDEGVLQLTRFVSPDPLGEIYARRGLGVNTFETIGWSLILPAADQSTGGDAGEGGDQASTGRPQPIKPVALWSGVVPLDKNGHGQVTFKVPSYQGELRVMAVAAGVERIGSAQTSIKVRDPLALTASFPRFMVKGDGMVAPVFVQNLTGKEQKVTVRLESSAELTLTGPAEETLSLQPDEAGVAVFTGKSTTAHGAAQIKISARSELEESSAEATVPMQPDAPVVREINYVELKPGDNDLSSLFKGFDPTYEQTTVTVSGRRFMQQLQHLNYLIRYPYGCIEQTTSTTRPLLYIMNLLPAIDPKAVADGTVEQKFMAGINRILSMQTSDGGFAYWPGEQHATMWATANVTYLLLEAIDAGYPVPKERVDEALAFIERTLTDSPDKINEYGHSVPQAEPYMQFVLARAGRGRAKRVQELIAAPNAAWGGMATENLYLLKAALYKMGDRTWERDLKSPPSTIATTRGNDWNFWSERRTAGLILNIGEELFPGDPGLEPLTRALADSLADPDSPHYTTQDLSWGISALGKRAGGLTTDWAAPTLTLDGRAVTAALEPENAKDKSKGSRAATFNFSGASGKNVTLKVDWVKGGKLFALVQVEGFKPGAKYLATDNSLAVRRAYRKLDGSAVALNQVALGEVVFVELTVNNPTQGKIMNVALVDRFGSGLEIENPRLNREHLAPWVQQDKLWAMDYMNIRDDRIELFGALEPGEVKFVYALRATVPGTFATPPIRAEAMYDPTIWSQSLGTPVTIAAPWKKL